MRGPFGLSGVVAFTAVALCLHLVEPAHAISSQELIPPVTAYFDMMDFVRTQAWAKPFKTPSAERQRCLKLLGESWAELPAEVRTGILKLPAAWAKLKQQWAGMSAAQRRTRCQRWRQQLLLPGQLLPPLADVATYRSKSGAFSLEFPSHWRKAEAQDGEDQYLFLGDTPAETTWDQVIDPARSPGGALFMITPMTDEIREVGGPLALARAVAQLYVGAGTGTVKEVGVIDGGKNGAIITLGGKWPGAAGARFYWVGVVPYGPDYVLAGRLGGPVSQGAELVPALSHIVGSLETYPERMAGSSDDEASLAVSLSTSIIGNAVCATSW